MKNSIFLFAVLFAFSFAHAQSDTTSLRINSIKDDTARAIAWYRAGMFYLGSDTGKTHQFANEAFKLSEKLKYNNGLIAAYHLYGELSNITGDFDQAILYYNKSLDICLKIGDKKSAGKRYNNLAGMYSNKGDYKKSVDYFLKCIGIFESIDFKQGMAYGYIGIGNIFVDQNNLDKALDYYTKGLTLSEELKDKKGMASALDNLGMVCSHKNDHLKQIEYLTKALVIKKEMGDKNAIANSYDRLGGAYGSLGEFEKSKKYLNEALKMFTEIGNKEALSIEYTNLGEEAFSEGQYSKARDFFKMGLDRAIPIKYAMLIQYDYDKLASASEKCNDYKNAYKYHVLYTDMKDSVLNLESAKQVAEMDTKYQTEKKALQIKNLKNEKDLQQSEIEKQSAEVKRQNIQKLAFAGGFGLMLILAFVVFRGYQQKKKANETILSQKQEVELQKEIIEEKQKEIIDSINYARRIQQSQLPTEKYIEKSLNRLRKG